MRGSRALPLDSDEATISMADMPVVAASTVGEKTGARFGARLAAGTTSAAPKRGVSSSTSISAPATPRASSFRRKMDRTRAISPRPRGSLESIRGAAVRGVRELDRPTVSVWTASSSGDAPRGEVN